MTKSTKTNKQACNSKSKEAKCHPYHKWSMYNRAYWSKKEKPHQTAVQVPASYNVQYIY